MTDQPRAMISFEPDLKATRDLMESLQRATQLGLAMWEDFAPKLPTRADIDPFDLSRPFAKLAFNMASNPLALMRSQFELLYRYSSLFSHSTLRAMGFKPEPLLAPAKGDRRFRHAAWDDMLVFDFFKQFYLLTGNWMMQQVASAQGLSEKDSAKIQFFTQQFIDAMSPSNFLMTNPEVLQATIESRGANLISGMKNLLHDMQEGAISQTDMDAYELGENVATSPGKVVFQNDLLQLLQFEPTTKQVYQRPLMIVPPWINKYYILDLQPENSFIRWAVSKGYTVFVVSWVNPGPQHADVEFEDYMTDGFLAALDAVESATGIADPNVIGYCIGGTLTAATLAYLAATDQKRVNSATFFAAQVDFSEPGDLAVFIDEQQLDNIDQRMTDAGGFLDGKNMGAAFNMLRSNDLIWSYVVNNYLLGKAPYPFDLLYWNADATRMPRKMHNFYLRNMYLENRLAEPGGIELGGVPIDLRKVEIPIFLQSARLDHIAPYQSVYKATQLFSGQNQFMLAGSGHIAGVVNPPAAKKYGYTTNSKTPATIEEWLDGATEHEGSWWPHWHRWLSRKSGPKVSARQPGDGSLEVIEDAPGSYAKGS